MRAALYARYSTDNQNELSVADQLALCRRHAEKIGAHVVREFADEGISGTSMANRPQVRELMAFARAGGCDVVIAEHTNRLSRDGEDGWGIFKRLQALGVKYVTAEEGRVTTLKQAVSTLVSELKIEEGRAKTRRGMRGMAERGKNVTTPPYGYRRTRAYDAAGEPIRGLMEIHAGEAEVVRRIFRDWAAGTSALAIATALNAEGVAAPRGGLWCDTTIRAPARIGKGILHNELYRGVRVWGRRTFSKNRETGGRIGRQVEDASEILRLEVPELAIVGDDLWRAAQARAAAGSRAERLGGRPAGAGQRFLQGLIVCGVCGGPMNMAGPSDRIRCANRTLRGACGNPRTPSYAEVEARVATALRSELLHPDLVEHAVRTIQEGLRAAQRDSGQRQAKLSAELAEVGRRSARLIDQLEAGAPWSAIAQRHAALEARASELRGQLEAPPAAQIVQLAPNAGRKYKAFVEGLRAALEAPALLEEREAREAVRALIGHVQLTPLPARGQFALEIVGDLAPLFDQASGGGCRSARTPASYVEAGTGFPASSATYFSVPFRQAA